MQCSVLRWQTSHGYDLSQCRRGCLLRAHRPGASAHPIRQYRRRGGGTQKHTNSTISSTDPPPPIPDLAEPSFVRATTAPLRNWWPLKIGMRIYLITIRTAPRAPVKLALLSRKKIYTHLRRLLALSLLCAFLLGFGVHPSKASTGCGTICSHSKQTIDRLTARPKYGLSRCIRKCCPF